jgi:hypothetical protein
MKWMSSTLMFLRRLQKVRNFANLGESLVAISEFLTVDYKRVLIGR